MKKKEILPLQSIYRLTSVAHKNDRSSEASQAQSLTLKTGLASMIFPRADSREAMLRYASCQVLKSYLIMAEIMFSDMDGMYIHDAVSILKEHGLYKQKVKKIANEALAVVEEMNRKSRSSDRDMVAVFCKVIFPYYTLGFINDGGALSDRLRLMFRREFIDELRCIEFCSKNAFDKAKVKSSEMCAKVSMSLLVTNTLKELKEALEVRVKCAIPGYPGLNSLLGKENEKLLAVSHKLMEELGIIDVALPEKEGMQARKMAENFQRKLLKQEMLDKVQSVIQSAQMDYTEYTIAHLKMDMMERNGTLPFGHYRVLLMRLGTHDNVVRLLKEIWQLPDPEEGMDLLDYKDELPSVSENSVLFHFRRLCVEDKVMVPDAKDKIPVKLRSLRVIAERNGGVLPIEELKKLYRKLGTKKELISVLKKAGPELAESIKKLKGMRVELLKAA